MYKKTTPNEEACIAKYMKMKMTGNKQTIRLKSEDIELKLFECKYLGVGR